MVEKTWVVVKIRHCDRVNRDVALEVQKTYPPEMLGFQPAHLGSHRCSNGKMCMAQGMTACVWSGGNPLVDPFRT